MANEVGIVLNERQIKILLYLINKKDWLTSEELSEYFNVNKKTIQHEIKHISESLSADLMIDTNKHKGYKVGAISEKTRKLLSEDLYLRDGKNSLTSISSKIVIFLLFYKDYVTMQTLADAFYISKTAVSLKIDVIRRWIKRYKGLSLEVSRRKGLKIHGDELQKRVYCSIHATPSVFDDMPFSDNMKHKYREYYQFTEHILKNVCINNKFIITGEDLKKNTRFIVISLIRSELGYERKSAHLLNTDHFLASKIVEEIYKMIDYQLNDSETDDIQVLLNQSSTFFPLNFSNENTRGGLENFLSEISQLMGIRFDTEKTEMNLMEDYLNKKMLREQNGNIVTIHYNEEIVIQYPLETYLVQRYISLFFPIEYVKELNYFSLYLTSLFNRYKNAHSILLVSDQSVSTMLYLKNYLLNDFSNMIKSVDIMPVYQYYHQKNEIRDYNVLLTTNQNVMMNEEGFFLIDPILNKKDQANIEEHIKQTIKELNRKEEDKILNVYYNEETVNHNNKRYERIEKELLQRKKEEEVFQTFSDINLYRCSISNSSHSKIKIWNLNKPLSYEYKKISRVIEVHYNTTDNIDILAFFDAVSDILYSYK